SVILSKPYLSFRPLHPRPAARRSCPAPPHRLPPHAALLAVAISVVPLGASSSIRPEDLTLAADRVS
ncbi:hypothetical protein SDJN02_13908, partial [Cucurbita argyrosperma subsp. argyrosperma]